MSQPKKSKLRRAGRTMTRWAEKLIRRSYSPKPERIHRSDFKGILERDIPRDISLYLPDSYYFVLRLETLLNFIRVDWTDEREYQSDKFDCDDFATAFASNYNRIFQVNSCLGASFVLKNPQDLSNVGFHRACVCICKDGEKMFTFLVDPMFEGKKSVVKMKPDENPVINNWLYHIIRIDW